MTAQQQFGNKLALSAVTEDKEDSSPAPSKSPIMPTSYGNFRLKQAVFVIGALPITLVILAITVFLNYISGK